MFSKIYKTLLKFLKIMQKTLDFLRNIFWKNTFTKNTLNKNTFSHTFLSAFGNNALVVILWNIYSLSNI